MAESFELEIATPERLLARVQAIEAQIPAANGYLGILPDHAPLLSELGIGAMTYQVLGGQTHHLVIHGGWVEVTPGSVRVLATKAEDANEIDEARAEEAMKRAAQRLSNPELGLDMARALNALKRAQARLAARKLLQQGVNN
ncbi:MAG: ATP synthase F1 subunit epsilon [Acidobacteriia bacterium]|nr:ATP synthase F1 subunit epsilon [Terriglobia bacterium]